MGTAINYIEQLNSTFNSFKDDYNECFIKLNHINLLELDILHVIEGSNFNAYEGYMLCKKLKEIRMQRRDIKNELRVLQIIQNNFISKNYKQLKQISTNVNDMDLRLSKTNSILFYRPRVLSSVNLKTVINNEIEVM
jgi:hypothetical protein